MAAISSPDDLELMKHKLDHIHNGDKGKDIVGKMETSDSTEPRTKAESDYSDEAPANNLDIPALSPRGEPDLKKQKLDLDHIYVDKETNTDSDYPYSESDESYSESEEPSMNNFTIPDKYKHLKNVIRKMTFSDDMTQEKLVMFLEEWCKMGPSKSARPWIINNRNGTHLQLEDLKAKGDEEYNIILSICNWVLHDRNKTSSEKFYELDRVENVWRKTVPNGRLYKPEFYAKNVKADGCSMHVRATVYSPWPFVKFKLWECEGLE